MDADFARGTSLRLTLWLPVAASALLGSVFAAETTAQGSSTPPSASLRVTTQASPSGSIAPTSASVSAGGRAVFTLTPAPGAVLVGVSGCGGTLEGNQYTTGSISSACKVVATFARPQPKLQGLNSPWGMTVLPDGRLLVTERVGHLVILDATRTRIEDRISVPLSIGVVGQGGLLDIALDPDFATDPWVYVSYAERGSGAEDGLLGTAVARARFDGKAFSGWQVIYRQVPKDSRRVHFGSRLVFRADKTLFVTAGDRGRGSPAQDLAATIGKVVRIRRDGSIPTDNPAIEGARPEIWSLGHRNIQGAAIRPGTNDLWAHEHGAQGGDELNRVQAGGNYGWPVVSYGCNYGDPVGEACRIGGGVHAPKFIEPVGFWGPTSVAPSGLVFYTGTRFAPWNGNVLLGTLAGTALWRVELEGDRERRRERLFADLRERIRDVEQAPDGAIYLLTDSGKLFEVRD